MTLSKGLLEYIQDLDERPSGQEGYAKAILYPQKLVDQRFIYLELEGRRVDVTEYATKEHVQILLDSLSDFDTDFGVNYRTQDQIRKMPIIHSFLTSPEHCHITELIFELRMYEN